MNENLSVSHNFESRLNWLMIFDVLILLKVVHICVCVGIGVSVCARRMSSGFLLQNIPSICNQNGDGKVLSEL